MRLLLPIDRHLPLELVRLAIVCGSALALILARLPLLA
jgi:hypothetical protein